MRPVRITKASQKKKSYAPHGLEVIQLPIEVEFSSEGGGEYDFEKPEVIDSEGRTYNPFEPFEKDAVRFAFTFSPGTERRLEDPWSMRAEIFMKWVGEEEPFSDKYGMSMAYGRFGLGSEDLTIPVAKLAEGGEYHDLPFSSSIQLEYEEWYLLIAAAMTREMSDWPKLATQFDPRKVARLCQPLALAIRWEDGRPFGVIACSGILSALIATVQVDAISGAKWRFCACEGCHKSFKVKRVDQRYCDGKCTHRQVVRNGREDRGSENVKQTKVKAGGKV